MRIPEGERIGYFTQDRGETFHEARITAPLYSRLGRVLREATIIRSSDGGLTYREGERVDLDADLPIFWGGKLKEGHSAWQKR